MNPPVLALDVGGTKLAAGLVSADGEVTALRRVATPLGSQQLVFDTLVELAEAVLHEAGSPVRQGIGVASTRRPGPASRSALASNNGIPSCPFARAASDSVGGRLILDGHLVGGGTGNAGRIGHVVVDRHLRVPYGRRLEVLASGLRAQASPIGAAALVHHGDAY